MLSLFKKIFKLTFKFDKIGVIKFNIILIFSSLIEGLSIALIFPILGLISKDQNSLKFFERIPFLNFDQSDIILIALITLFLVFFLKSFLLLFFSWWKSGFIFRINNGFSTQIFKNYIHENYEFFLKNKPSLLLRNSYNEIRIFIQAVDLFFKLLIEVFVLLVISLVLFYYYPLITIIIFLMFSFLGFIFLFLTKNSYKSWSQKKLNFSGKLIQILQQSFESIKYLKISNSQNKVLDDYNFNIRNFSKYTRYSLFFSDIPRNLFELFGVLALVITVFFLVKINNIETTALLPTLGLFGAASFRIIPGVNRITNLSQSIYTANASIMTVYNDLNNLKKIDEKNETKKIPFEKSIKFINVSYKYPNSNNFTLKNLSFEIKKNDCVCLVGESGIGKTTLIDLISGLISPSNGQILVDNKELKNELKIKDWQRNIGYIPQIVSLYNASIVENITFGKQSAKIDSKLLNDSISLSGLNEFVLSKKEGIEFQISERGSNLSGGQIQRFAIARSLYLNPEVLICDEFTSALDEKNQDKILDSLNKLAGRTTLIFISHNNKVIKKANKILKLKKNINNETIIENE